MAVPVGGDIGWPSEGPPFGRLGQPEISLANQE